MEEKENGTFLTTLSALLSFWAKISNQKPKITPFTKFYLDPQKNSEDMIPLFLMSWHIENDDYDIIPSNWRWRHQTF